MKVQKILIIAFASTVLFTSCKKVLLKDDPQNLVASQIYNDTTLVKPAIDYIYTQNLPGWFGNTGGAIGSGSSLTEEAYGDNVFVKGSVTIESVEDIGTAASKTGNYGKIRTINTFVKDLSAGSLSQSVKNRYLAQALFFRAFRYFDLVRLYGGVPIILTPLDAIGNDAKNAALLPRNSTTACFKQIISDLDTAIKYLPNKWSNIDYGRITAGAAAAFKGRVLLTYASPQFNPTNDGTRWQNAYNANVTAVNILTANGYGLNSSYDNMWFTEGYANKEAVMVTAFNTFSDANGSYNNNYDNSTRPAYLGTGGGSNQPTWDLVQAYPMLDGKAPGTSTKYSYDVQTFYKNRDPRFNKTIAYNGCNWPILGNASYRLWTYYYYSAKNSSSSVKSTESTASSTGFYLRKAIDPNITAANLPTSGTDWMEIRYAEVLLNLAESAAEVGNLGVGQEAYANLIAVRKRAGIEAGDDGLYGLTAGMSHDQMITAIMYERQIEFAFEGKRYWDLRRRKLLESTLNGKKRTGLTVLLNNDQSGSDYLLLTRDASANSSLDNLYSTSFTVTPKVLDTYSINVQSADYFFGLPTAAIQNNPNLQQTNTWGGSFDPLQ
ncbi:RagB/SusD family nutrient uptake outer membrane protein [Mucilaginibacter sp. SP1R1]|uniref:RagB/SusD family nutrient uptake outer membrane protein n=1 Tax=Mucilaginibacter sp. SP1R1 TaxID=2723091 RepID=UPI0017E38F0E|nr:RagB/SusD family nutrient uptake outer membrane protein [Mucilaginibacter sp. SP1R1]MBB6148602.1 hypothetical protein [Mucilaginibacter sp. SP1R1]